MDKPAFILNLSFVGLYANMESPIIMGHMLSKITNKMFPIITGQTHTLSHIHKHYIYIYIYVCVCVCV